MKTRASIAGHPVHPMLVVFPIGLWVFSFICDLIFLVQGDVFWHDMAFYSMAGGVIGALAAAVPGAMDLLSMTDADTRRIGLVHMSINLSLVVLFVINLWWRTQVAPEIAGPVLLSAVSVGLLGVSGWLGGEMVYVHAAGVNTAAARREATTAGRVFVERRRPGGSPYYGPERRHAQSGA